jgi:hypothetical protein
VSTETLQLDSDQQRRRNQIKLLAIFAVAGVPVIVAMLMYFGSFAIPAGKTNKGELIIPALSLNAFGLQATNDGLYEETQGKWLLIQTGRGECDTICQDMAHTARQVNILMAREQGRVARVFMTSDEQIYRSTLAQDYPELQYLPIDDKVQAALPGIINSEADSTWQLWISDPLGNVILHYDTTHSGYDLKDDLKKLLKLSNIG